MRNIEFFRALRYNPEKADPSLCAAPPYDVFDYGDETDIKLRSEPVNIVHIQKPAGGGDEKYSNARKVLDGFLSEGVLIKENSPGVYIIRQSWRGGSRTGLIASVKLDETYKRVRRHEKTKPAPIEDRFKLTEATGLNIGSIFCVFPDPELKVSGLIKRSFDKPLYDFEFPSGIRNRVFLSENCEIPEALEDKTLYIADGHHRYHTMLKYREIMRKRRGSSGAYEYTMMYLVPESEAVILPYHRLLKNIDPGRLSDLPGRLAEDFNIAKQDKVELPPRGSAGFYLDPSYYIITPKKKINIPDSIMLHETLIEPFLGIPMESVRKGEFIDFLPGDSDISSLPETLRRGPWQGALLMAAPGFDEIRQAADTGISLPPKSTYFYPKIPTGIVMRSLL